jgi:multidrug efflux pump subunit AcrB
VDIYVRPEQEDLGRIATQIHHILDTTQTPHGIEATLLGSVESMNASFRSFGVGLILSVVLLYLVLVAQFRSFLDPFIILLAIPPGITGVLVRAATVENDVERHVADGCGNARGHRTFE